MDLAGSERVNKMALGGQLLTEAKYINVSLHYLEQVAGGSRENRLDTHFRVVAVAVVSFFYYGSLMLRFMKMGIDSLL